MLSFFALRSRGNRVSFAAARTGGMTGKMKTYLRLAWEGLAKRANESYWEFDIPSVTTRHLGSRKIGH
jgi:hypothetical protein